MKEKEIRFEEALEKLEDIVGVLEGGEIALDDALKKYEEGVKLSRLCSERLAQAEKKVEILTKTLNGELKAEPFHREEGEGSTSAQPKKKAKKKPASSEEGGTLF